MLLLSWLEQLLVKLERNRSIHGHHLSHDLRRKVYELGVGVVAGYRVALCEEVDKPLLGGDVLEVDIHLGK